MKLPKQWFHVPLFILVSRLEGLEKRSIWALHERQQVSSDGVILPQNESRSPTDVSVFRSHNAQIDTNVPMITSNLRLRVRAGSCQPGYEGDQFTRCREMEPGPHAIPYQDTTRVQLNPQKDDYLHQLRDRSPR
jgi:hypothetical protein